MFASPYRVTVDQWENDDEGDYGIINIYAPVTNEYICAEVFNGGDSVEDMFTFLTGREVHKTMQTPFNPYGDGREWLITAKA